MKNLKIYLSLLLCACFLCSCAGNTTESTPDNASSDITVDTESSDITADTESSINDVSDNSIQQEESSLPEDNSSKEPSVNDSFSMDKVVWYTGTFFNIGDEIDKLYGNETLSYGLMEHAAANSDKDIWYPVDIKVLDNYYDYGCVIDDEYTKKWNDIRQYPEELAKESGRWVCYITPELFLQIQRETNYIWMPHPDEVEERWKSATTAP